MTSGTTMKNDIGGSIVPDGGWGWIIVFASFMIHFIMDGITYSMGDVFLRPMIERLQSNRAYVSAIFGMLPAITLATGPIATIFTNTFGCRKVTIIGSIIAALGFFASCFWPNIWFYYLTIGVIGGLGFGLIYLPAIVSVGFYFERKRSLAMGIAVCGSGLGTLAFPALMPYIINEPLWMDYDGVLLIESSIIFICIIFGVLMIPLPQEPSEIRRIERKTRRLNKENANETVRSPLKSGIDRNDEQRSELIPAREKEIPLETIESIGRESSSAVVPAQQQSISMERIDSSPRDDQLESVDEKSIVLSRKDATYQGSLHHIPLYNENPAEYHRQMLLTNEKSSQLDEKQVKKSFLQQLSEQLDLKLLRDGAFALFAISNFLTSLGFNVPYNFANDLASDAKVEEHRRHWIIMSIGIANCFGRVIIGFLGDRSFINRLYLYNLTLIIAGIATILAPFCNELVYSHMIYAAFFGFFSGGYVGLTSIIVVDLVGVDKLSDAFGVLLLFQGVAVAIGSPITGAMRDAFTDFDRPYFWPYLIMGGSIVLSGLILFAIPLIKRQQERRQQPTKHQLDMGVLSYSKQNLSNPEEKQQI